MSIKVPYYNSTNTNRLERMRDNYLKAYEAMNVHHRTAEHLVVLTTLNALLRVASQMNINRVIELAYEFTGTQIDRVDCLDIIKNYAEYEKTYR